MERREVNCRRRRACFVLTIFLGTGFLWKSNSNSNRDEIDFNVSLQNLTSFIPISYDSTSYYTSRALSPDPQATIVSGVLLSIERASSNRDSAPAMNSIGENCNELKKQYDACFNSWFTDKFLKGSTNDAACAPLFKIYQQCVKVSLYIYMHMYTGFYLIYNKWLPRILI